MSLSTMKLKQALIVNIPILLVELLTIVLLVYIAYAEVNRTIPKFHLEKLAAETRTQANALSNHLANLPLDQYVGFNALSEAFINSSEHNELNHIVDTNKEIIFENSRQEELINQNFMLIEGMSSDDLNYLQSEQSYQLVSPLENKFHQVGELILQTNKTISTELAKDFLKTITIACSIVFFLFFAFVQSYSIFAEKYPKLKEKNRLIINIVYLLSFIIIATILTITVYTTYERAALAKTKALSNAFEQRVESILDLGIKLEDISGISKELHAYKESNPDIKSMTITHNQEIKFDTNTHQINQPYQTIPQQIEYRKDLNIKDDNGWELIVNIPREIINDKILSRAKEFIVLFLACGLISWVFLDAGNSLSERIRQKNLSIKNSKSDDYSLGLKLVKPAYFLIVFTSALPISFLPAVVFDMSLDTSSSLASATLPFSIFYIVFALILIPAGSYAERGSLNKMMLVGFIAELIGLLLIAFFNDFWILTLGRAFSGFGQGVFLIGLNSYTLSITPENKRTEGAAVKVNGRNAALVAGTAIGALLFSYMDYQGVFALSAAVSLVGIFYVWYLVPSTDKLQKEKKHTIKKPKVSLIRNIFFAIKDTEFMKTLLLIGLVGKIAIAGITMFAIPLVLAQKGYKPEVIGQALMLFYISSIIITSYVSKRVDRTGNSKNILFISAFIGGMGMFLIGILDITEWKHDAVFPGFEYLIHTSISFNQWTTQFAYIPELSTLLVLTGIIITGASNGLLAAPVMTHIDKTAIAQTQGSKSVATTYIFLERGGHIVGPIVASQLLLLTHNTTLGIALFGLITLLFGLFFLVFSKR